MPEQTCLGCRLANHQIEAYVVYETDLLTCLLDIAPIHEGHLLIVPKEHVRDVDELGENVACAVMRTAAMLASVLKRHYKADGVTIMQNNGVFNDLNHYHMHVFPRYVGDGFAWWSQTIRHMPAPGCK